MSVLSGIAELEAARLRDGTLPWSWWLDHGARHGRYGFTNTLLIAAQWRLATDVRSYEEWRAQGRQVRKGESGIRIVSRGGRARSVFDIAQTDGIPLPTPPALPAAQAQERLRRVAYEHGLNVRGATASALGYRLGVLLLPGGDRQRHVEAESVAYLVLTHLGLPTSHLRFPPVVVDADIRRMGDRILDAALQIRERLDGPSRDEIAAIQAEAHRFFRSRTPDSWVPPYLAGRGFPVSVQRNWAVGYAPRSWRALTDHLRGLGHRDDEIVASGLGRKGRRGVLYDTFRDRVMLPIRDAAGTVAGFIGRLPDGAAGPVYLNSPGTALFRKGELLFGLGEARGRLADGARPILVEGPFDAIAVSLAGGDQMAAVAPCGASLTPAQLRTLGRVAALDETGLLVALDGDHAGRSGAVRTWDVLAGVGGPIDAVMLPDGADPADLLRGGTLREALRSVRPLADLVVDASIERAGGALGCPEERMAAVRASASVIARMAPARVARQAARVAGRLDLDHATVARALAEAVTGGATSSRRAPGSWS